MTPQPLASVKLQHLEGRDYRRLCAAPVKIFAFDSWAHAPVDSLCEARTSPPLPLEVSDDGVMSALLIYFTLDLDGDPANAYGDALPASCILLPTSTPDILHPTSCPRGATWQARARRHVAPTGSRTRAGCLTSSA